MERNINVADYYNRFKAADNYKRVLFRDGYVLQGAELNEMQDMGVYRLRGIADALFKDGDIVKDAQIAVDPATGVLKAQAGQVYLDGEVRDIPAAAFTIHVRVRFRGRPPGGNGGVRTGGRRVVQSGGGVPR